MWLKEICSDEKGTAIQKSLAKLCGNIIYNSKDDYIYFKRRLQLYGPNIL
jgi:hypothetical protein